MSEGRRPNRRVATRLAMITGLLWGGGLCAQSLTAPSLDEVLRRMGAYVAGYGNEASVIVAVERYTQRVSGRGFSITPRTLVAEFAVVKAPADEGWTGYRDVVEVNGERIPDRANRLLKLFTGPSQSAELLRRIDSENARFNVGPVLRNINVPTMALYFLHPSRQPRFVFKKTGETDLDGIATWEISFKETARPTIIRTRARDNVPVDGLVWVMPGSGTVVKTRFRAQGFADGTGVETREVRRMESVEQPTPPQPATSGAGGTSAPQAPPPAPPQREVVTTRSDPVRLESLAEIEVTYRRQDGLGLWLPWTMSELYEGPFRGSVARAETTATYSDFKRFTTEVRLRNP